MATVNLGSIKFKWKGTYAGGTAYTIDDVVSYNGSSYICILASTGNLPTNATYFEQMSSAGTNGTDLTTTLTTQGDLVYRDGSGLVRLGAGTAGQVLQTGGAGANPSWGTAPSGKILQVVSSNFTTAFADTTLSSWTTVTGYEASITPSSSSNTIIVNFNFNVATGGSGGADILRHFKVIKTISATTTDDSPLHTGSVGGGVASTANNIRSNFDVNGSIPVTIQYVSSPSTTSAITYKLQFYGTQSGSVFINRLTSNPSSYSEGASTITLMEVSA
jgi:hypothetical protein